MYAIIEVKGKQFKVEKGSKILVDYLGEGEVAAPEIKTVLLKKEDESVTVGTPYVEGVEIVSKVDGLRKGDKIRVFKYKKRKDYRRTQGHRQKYHRLLIEDIKA